MICNEVVVGLTTIFVLPLLAREWTDCGESPRVTSASPDRARSNRVASSLMNLTRILVFQWSRGKIVGVGDQGGRFTRDVVLQHVRAGAAGYVALHPGVDLVGDNAAICLHYLRVNNAGPRLG